MYLAGWHVEKSDLNGRFYMLQSTFLMRKLTKSIHKAFTCQPSKYREVETSGSNSLQSPSNLVQKCSSCAANC